MKMLTRAQIYNILLQKEAGELLAACIAESVDLFVTTKDLLEKRPLDQIIWSSFTWSETELGGEFWSAMAVDLGDDHP